MAAPRAVTVGASAPGFSSWGERSDKAYASSRRVTFQAIQGSDQEGGRAAATIYRVLGVWLVETYRSQFAQEINARGIDGLISALAERNKSNAGGKKG